MKVLIIGSKGFIGTACVNYFLHKGYEVYGCDVVTDYNDPFYFLVDATNANYEELFSSIAFDGCINCSGAASVPDSLIHPLRDYALNTHNVILMLEAIRKSNKACRFINLSSAAVYGNPASLPIKESDPVNPISPYGWHKYYAEMACAEYTRFYNLQTCNVRIFSAYGPGLRKQLFWDLHSKFNNNPHVMLLGTGKESRDFVFIDDIAWCLELLLNKADFNASVYNLAGGQQVFIEDAVRLFGEHFSPRASFSFSNEVRQGDPINWQADISKLSTLGFEPKVNIEEGIKKYVAWLRID